MGFVFRYLILSSVFVLVAVLNAQMLAAKTSSLDEVKAGFQSPSLTAKPGVYWYFMDGNFSREGITADLESMRDVGIGHVVFLEVNVGVPRGKIDMLSPEWLDMFKHAVRECERLGVEMSLGIGPGWAGSGGPWVKAEESMQHLVTTSTLVSGPKKIEIQLPVPPPKSPFFGEGVLTPEARKQWSEWYEDVAVLAYPTPKAAATLSDIDEKALYIRAPYTSMPGVKPSLPAPANHPDSAPETVIQKDQVLDLTDKVSADGKLTWDAPEGEWTIARFVARNNGAITRPAPQPGLGFEADKFSTTSLKAHLDHYVGRLLDHVGPLDTKSAGGLKALHIDSWEMGAQNWTQGFRNEFQKRRGYDPLPYYPVYGGSIINSVEQSERFLWDLRLTSQELVIENHAQYVKQYANELGLKLSIEPYDMNPASDIELGAVADIPMCEFWSKGFGFNSTFSCLEAVSIAHVNGSPIVQAEAFTGDPDEAWKQHPGSMKNQGDWAFATGVNRFFYHTFQHQPLDSALKPGMAMGPYGVHWDRNQTFWPMVGEYHKYIARCQQVLQQGRTVADILYLTAEGAPHVFQHPASAITGEPFLPDRKGFNFDGCAPSQLYSATVKDGRIVFPAGASYRVLCLPKTETMTPALLKKIKSLSDAGATIIGKLPAKSPSLVNQPEADQEVEAIAASLSTTVRDVPLDGQFADYAATADLLRDLGLHEDFITSAPLRYTHRTSDNWEVYFVSNTTSAPVTANCGFRVGNYSAELWNGVTGKIQPLQARGTEGGLTTISLSLNAFESCFVVFNKDLPGTKTDVANPGIEADARTVASITTPWTVAFDPTWGGPSEISFNTLTDWSEHQTSGVKYYSGIATYRNTFEVPSEKSSGPMVLDLGSVHEMARVKVNGKNVGVVWTAPYQVDVTTAVKGGRNELEIEVVNLWPNRLIGDEQLPYDGPEKNQWPEWLLNGTARPSGRFAFTTYRYYKKDSPLLKSGLLGPVILQQVSAK